VECAGTDSVGLDLADLTGGEAAQARQAVGAATLGEPVEGR